MTITLTHLTQESQLHDSLKCELQEAIEKASPVPVSLKGLNKDLLMAMARRICDEMAREHSLEEERKDAQRKEDIKTQTCNPIIHYAFLSLHRGLKRHVDKHTESLQEYQTKVSQSSADHVMWNTAHLIEQAMFDCEMLRHLQPLFEFVSSQSILQDRTVEEFLQLLSDQTDNLTRDCLRDSGYRHNSTSAISNIENIQQFRAKQTMALLLKTALDAFGKDLTATTVNQAGHGQYLYVY